MNATTESAIFTGHVSNQERAMRTALGLTAIVGVLAGGITGEGHMFVAAVLCIYLGMTAIMGLDPFYFLAEKLMKADANTLRAGVSVVHDPQAIRIVSRHSRRAA